MSQLGHSLPMRLVPRLARCPEYPESRHEAPAQYLTRWANKRHHDHLFDHLVGGRKQRLWHIKTEGLGGLEIDDEIELGWLYDRQVGRLLAFENPADDACLSVGIGRAGAIGD
jgi:hypothetical protein